MKDVIEILSKRLARLESSFSLQWTSDFLMLMEYLKANQAAQHIMNSIQEKKKHAHMPLFEHMQSLFKDGSNCLKQIKRHTASDSTEALIKSLLEMNVDSNCIRHSFFEMESVFVNYCQTFHTLFKEIHVNHPNVPVAKYCSISAVSGGMENLSIKLSFSPYLQLCHDEIGKLAGLRDFTIWGKWDELLKWEEWTKNGISPNNEVFEHNLAELFKSHKISHSVQSCGLFFIESLSNMKALSTSYQANIKAFEIYLDKDDQFWIITHFEGETDDKKPFFIKRLQREAQSYHLAKLLMDREPYTFIDLPMLSHTLGELEIKKELKKVFFLHGKFIGCHVKLSTIPYPINIASILEKLTSLQQKKTRLPPFNWGEHLKYSLSSR